MQEEHSTGLPRGDGPRPRAAFLHIAKCAGTSVRAALSAAVGNPPQPPQQFDSCYVAGLDRPDLLSDAARSQVAWNDQPVGVGDYTFHVHWSLPTLRSFFQPGDIATVLRDPLSRILSYVEYARSLPTTLHRTWYPDTLPLDLCRMPLVDVLTLPLASRATDNLITRQVLWHDPRLPIGDFIEHEAASLAADCTVGVADDPIGLTPIVVGIEAQQNRIVRGHSANRLASTRAWDGPDRFSSSSRLYKE